MKVNYHANSAYFPDIDVAAVSDLHIGLERAVREGGMSIPLHESEEIEKRIREVLTTFEPSELVINGDILHSFGEIGDSSEVIRRIESVITGVGTEPFFVEGNHDTMLASLVDTTKVYRVGDVVFTHGDSIPANLPDAELYVVGHDHPTIEIEMEKTNCFLRGPFEDSEVLMLPAFNPLCSGVAVNEMSSKDFMSPFIRNDFGEFRVVVENEDTDILEFPRLKEFRGML